MQHSSPPSRARIPAAISLKEQINYQTVWKLAIDLTLDEQIKLVEALIDHLYGFGMWKDQKEMEDIQSYVETMRRRDSYHPDGRLKTSEEFLDELKAWDE